MARAARVMRYVLMAATTALCLLLCWQAAGLYLTGNSPDNFSASGVRIAPVYSREAVEERLSALAPALLGYLALTAAGLVLEAAAGKTPGDPDSFQAAPRMDPAPAPPPENALPVLRAVLYAAALLFIALGAANGGLWDVLVKAVNICTECIGLG